MIDVDAVLQTDAFKNVSSEQIKLLKELMVRLDGKKGMEAFSILMEFSTKMPKDIKYTKKERAAMIHALIDAMPEQEQSNFRAMAAFLEKL